jgi:hypothetical protein
MQIDDDSYRDFQRRGAESAANRRGRRDIQSALLGLSCLLKLSLFGCGKSDNSPTQSGERTWTVSGEAHMLGAIAPLSGVVVKCGGVVGTSGDDGKYELKGVSEGKQTITAQKAECDNYSYAVDVNANTNHHIFMTFNGVDLTGTVVNTVEGPVSGASVSIRGLVALTDAAGKYEFTAVPHGADTLAVTHPRYNSYRKSVLMSGSVAQMNIALTRDSLFQGIVDMAKHVDQRQPNTAYFAPLDRMFLKANDPDSTAPYFVSYLQHIYISFTFPVFLYDQRVSVIEASLLMCSDGPRPATSIRAYSLQSPWLSTLTYNTQPATGSLLYTGTICDSSDAKFWQVLGTEGMAQLLSSFRTQGMVNGIVVKGVTPVGSVGFWSGFAARANQPKYTIKVRY